MCGNPQAPEPSRVEFAAMSIEVCAHITGTVWKIEVQQGEEVDEEQTLVILESMKMEMPVEAPQPGKVAKIAVVEGQAVDEGDVLVTLE
jgi:acetyl-CoA carboxylase biotin carboxyl carrier protein